MATKPHKWTGSQLAYVEVMCRKLTRKELCEQFNQLYDTSLTEHQIKAVMSRHGFKTGRDGRFKPGHVSQLPPGFVRKPNSGSFKKGGRPHNRQPVGTEVLRPEDGLIYVKVAEPKTWRSKGSLVWEQHHGRKVPKGHVIVFADGDRANFDIENLQLVSRGELGLFNTRGYGASSSEVRPTLLLATKVDMAVFKRSKKDKA